MIPGLAVAGDRIDLEFAGRTDAEARLTRADDIRDKGRDPIGYAGEMSARTTYDL